jgi:sulfide:quinone oxidoreductase
MAHIVVLGAGLGGMPAAYEARALFPKKEHQVTVINDRPDFQFYPSNPWVIVGWRKREQITIPIEPVLRRKGIHFIQQRVDAIDPHSNCLTLADGRTVDYDYLIISTGPRLAFEEVEGTGPHGGYTQSVCTVEHAELGRNAYREFLADPGPVIIGALPYASCFGPAYEQAFILDAHLRKKKLRKKVPITFVTSEPYIGHMGLGGVGDSQGLLEWEFRQRHIKWISNAKVSHVEDGMMSIDELDRAGNRIRKHELPFKYSMMLPGFKGVDVVANVEGLCNARGFIKIDDTQRSPAYPNIYAAGVCVDIPPVETTPVPTGAPKTGYMIESMVTAIVHNIAEAIDGKKPTHRGTWDAICLADMGDTGAAFVVSPQLPPRNVSWFKKWLWAHWAKIAFEKYFLRKMRNGTSEPVYEKFILKRLGISRLEAKG